MQDYFKMDNDFLAIINPHKKYDTWYRKTFNRPRRKKK